MRLHFLRPPKRRSPVLADLYDLLARRGHEVTEGIPDASPQEVDVAPRHDLYILKARTDLPMSVAGALYELGARVLNPYPACVTLRNKIVATAAMRRAGIPTPRTWAAAQPSLAASKTLAEHAPLIVKPFDGIHSQGITVVREPGQLAFLPPREGPVLVQEFIEGCTERIKLHCVGDRVFATSKPFSLGGWGEPGVVTEVSDELREIAVGCGRLFGLGLYGMDVLMGEEGPVVVDLNSFPGYDGLPGIEALLADYVEEYARGRIELAPQGSARGPL